MSFPRKPLLADIAINEASSLPTTPSLLYHCEDTSATVLANIGQLGAAWNGAITSADRLTTHPYGGSLHFNTAGDTVVINPAASPIMLTSGVTLFAIFVPATTGGGSASHRLLATGAVGGTPVNGSVWLAYDGTFISLTGFVSIKGRFRDGGVTTTLSLDLPYIADDKTARRAICIIFTVAAAGSTLWAESTDNVVTGAGTTGTLFGDGTAFIGQATSGTDTELITSGLIEQSISSDLADLIFGDPFMFERRNAPFSTNSGLPSLTTATGTVIRVNKEADDTIARNVKVYHGLIEADVLAGTSSVTDAQSTGTGTVSIPLDFVLSGYAPGDLVYYKIAYTLAGATFYDLGKYSVEIGSAEGLALIHSVRMQRDAIRVFNVGDSHDSGFGTGGSIAVGRLRARNAGLAIDSLGGADLIVHHADLITNPGGFLSSQTATDDEWARGRNGLQEYARRATIALAIGNWEGRGAYQAQPTFNGVSLGRFFNNPRDWNTNGDSFPLAWGSLIKFWCLELYTGTTDDTLANWHFDPAQLVQLRDGLLVSSAIWNVINLHQIGGSDDYMRGGAHSVPQAPVIVDELLPILLEAIDAGINVPIIFSGHDHYLAHGLIPGTTIHNVQVGSATSKIATNAAEIDGYESLEYHTPEIVTAMPSNYGKKPYCIVSMDVTAETLLLRSYRTSTDGLPTDSLDDYFSDDASVVLPIVELIHSHMFLPMAASELIERAIPAQTLLGLETIRGAYVEPNMESVLQPEGRGRDDFAAQRIDDPSGGENQVNVASRLADR